MPLTTLVTTSLSHYHPCNCLTLSITPPVSHQKKIEWFYFLHLALKQDESIRKKLAINPRLLSHSFEYILVPILHNRLFLIQAYYNGNIWLKISWLLYFNRRAMWNPHRPCVLPVLSSHCAIVVPGHKKIIWPGHKKKNYMAIPGHKILYGGSRPWKTFFFIWRSPATKFLYGSSRPWKIFLSLCFFFFFFFFSFSFLFYFL